MRDVMDLRMRDIADSRAQREADRVSGSQRRAGAAGAKPREDSAENNEADRQARGRQQWWQEF